MRTERLRVPCPGCAAGTVAVHRTTWTDGAHDRRAFAKSTWADEPCACSRGCRIPSPTLFRLLRAVDAGVLPAAHQLPLDLDTAWAGQALRLCAQAGVAA